jgi:hypothetical protein
MTGYITGPKGQYQAVVRDAHGIIYFTKPFPTRTGAKRAAMDEYPLKKIKWRDR